MGNMFSGKTSELIRRLERFKIMDNNNKILVANSKKDTRSTLEVLQTHDNVQFQCIKVDDIFELLSETEFDDSDIIAIDEAQFFTKLKRFVEYCLHLNKSVILSGLDADFSQSKFGELIDCIPLACDVIKLSAICMRCKDGTPGPFSKRIVDNTDVELVGGSETYIAVCRNHLK